MTKPKGIHANFSFTCVTCGEECTVTNSRPDPHQCRIEAPVTLAQLRAALETRSKQQGAPIWQPSSH